MAPSVDCPVSSPSTSSSPVSLPPKAEKQIAVNVVEITEEDPLDHERTRLRRHLGLAIPGEQCTTPQTPPLFFIERVPDTKHLKCKLPGCTEGIEPGDLRLALNPGMGEQTWFRSSSDYYHIPCFERLADLSDPAYLNRIQPLTRHTFKLRGLKASSVLDGSYLVSGGVERLILEWKITRGMAIEKRDGVLTDEAGRYALDADVYDLLYRAGEAGYWPPSERPGGLDQYEYYVLLRMLAPNECDRAGTGWNLFEAFLGDAEEGLGGRHDLSAMLRRWEGAVSLAWKGARDGVKVEGEQALDAMAVRAIRRLSIIPKPQAGFN
ncbi:hypothetical protein BJX61DRAFT_548178 [Aspergillus egyptiacus]|nr:hypothetical protein BJX61DRAFT_548178 [Aspergillus egyptiacus]